MTECPHGLTPETCSTCLHGPTPRETGELKTGTCRNCGADIIWGIGEKTGKKNPLNAEQVRDGTGNISIVGMENGDPLLRYGKPGSGEYISHFSTCKDADEFRKS